MVVNISEKLETLPTKRLKVLKLFTAGYSDKEIATELKIKTSTVRFHLYKLYKDFELRKPNRNYSGNSRSFLIRSHMKKPVTTSTDIATKTNYQDVVIKARSYNFEDLL